MNKKGGIIIPVVTLFAILILLYAVFSIYSDENQAGTENIGKLQSEIIALQLEAEGKLFYLDQLAKYSARKSADDLKNVQFTSTAAFLEVFGKRFGTEFENNVKLSYFEAPFDYRLDYEYENGTITIKGDARQEIVLKKGFVIYGVEHDFIYELDNKLVEKAKSKQLFEPQ